MGTPINILSPSLHKSHIWIFRTTFEMEIKTQRKERKITTVNCTDTTELSWWDYKKQSYREILLPVFSSKSVVNHIWISKKEKKPSILNRHLCTEGSFAMPTTQCRQQRKCASLYQIYWTQHLQNLHVITNANMNWFLITLSSWKERQKWHMFLKRPQWWPM